MRPFLSNWYSQVTALAAHSSFLIKGCRGLLLLTLLMVHLSSFAQAAELEAPKASDVRILIDISGSMKKNDPANLRRPALDMLIKLLPEGTQAGVWTFGKFVNMLVKHRPVDEQWKREASEKANTIGSIAQFTNIGEVLDKAAYDKAYSTRPNFQTHVILLTDGMVDIDRDPEVNKRERERIIKAILPNYQAVDYKIHTVSLSENADRQLMDQLALGTDGQSVIAKNADELMQVFLQVFDQAVPKEELPFEGNRFVTDSSIEEFTALIFRKPGSKDTEILSPDLSRYTKDTIDPNLNWYATDQYDLITVTRPFEGEWQVIAELLPESRITVVSDLSLAVKPLPTNLLIDDVVELSLALREENTIVDRAEFLELLDIDVELKQVESGRTETQRLSDGLVPGNGVYQTQLKSLDQTGQYEITVLVDGKSFQRQFVHRADVREAFAVDVQPIKGQSPQQYKIIITPNIKDIDVANTEVVAKLKKPSGASTITNFNATPTNTWEWILSASEDGEYQLSVRMTTTNAQGQRNSYTPNPFVINHPQGDNVFTPVESTPVKVEPEPLPEPIAPLSPVTPAATQETPAEEAPAPKPPEEQEPTSEDDESNTMQWILYGVIALVNVLIIGVIYILYRKFFGQSSEEKTDSNIDSEILEEETVLPVEEFKEPAMDEMNIADLEEEVEPEVAQTPIVDEPEPVEEVPETPPEITEDVADELETAIAEEDPLADLNPSELDDEDEDPEFDLDDFAPDSLDDDEPKT